MLQIIRNCQCTAQCLTPISLQSGYFGDYALPMFSDRTFVCNRRLCGHALTRCTITNNVNSSSASIELDFAVHEGEKSVIITDSDTTTGMKLRTYLPNKNVSRPNNFAAKLFDSPPLSIGIPTITAGALSLFVRHCFLKTAKTSYYFCGILPNFPTKSSRGDIYRTSACELGYLAHVFNGRTAGLASA